MSPFPSSSATIAYFSRPMAGVWGPAQFIGNEESGQKCAILYTIVENCRRLGINPKEYLTDVLIRLPGMLAKDAITLAQGTRRQTGSQGGLTS